MLAASRAWDDTLYPRAARDRLRRGQLTTPAPAPSGLSGLKKQREGQQAHPSCEDFSVGEGASRCLADISHTQFIQSSPSLHRQGERGTGEEGALTCPEGTVKQERSWNPCLASLMTQHGTCYSCFD